MSTTLSHADRGYKVIESFWIQSGVAILIVSLRMWARIYSKTVGWDDYLMLFTLFMFVVLSALVTYSASIGGFKHLYDLSDAQVTQVLKWNYIYQVWGVWNLTPGKASVAVLIYRIMMPLKGWRYWTLIIWIFILFVFNTTDCIFTYVQCDPARALWDKTIMDADCWAPSVQTNYAIAGGCINVFVDVLLAILPATIFLRLRISRSKKISLSILLGLGLSAAITGAFKTAYLASLSARSDLTWQIYDLVQLAGAELFVIIVCGSVPPIKPLWTKFISEGAWRASISSKLSSSRRSGGVNQDQEEMHGIKKRVYHDPLVESLPESRSVSEGFAGI